MFRYAKFSDYPGEFSHPIETKHYQERFLKDFLPKHCRRRSRVLEVGANINVNVLSRLRAKEKWIADPYAGIAGAAETELPDLGPGYIISRCVVGENSDALPSGFFDLIFSSSVLEHIGQEAAGFNCGHTVDPPEGQEAPRRAFCAECFRLLKPGGVTVHTIDHAVRNVSYDANFRGAGFVPLVEGETINVRRMMDDPEALRQSVTWKRPPEPMTPEQMRLHSVLLVGYRKPGTR